MKKIFYFIASAIVALGAVACQNEIDENITPGTQNEGLSFTATVDQQTKVEWNGLTPSWKEGDEVMIDTFTFVYDGEKFTCTEDGVVDTLVGKEKTATHGELDSTKGLEGTLFTATGVIANDCTLAFTPANALLKFTAPVGATLAGEGIFTTGKNTFTAEASEEVVYVPVKTTEEKIAFSYTVGEAEGKNTNIKFEAGKIYNLGTLAAAVASVDGVNYTDIATALYAAASTGKELVLASDLVLTEDLGMATFADVTIDLNGKTISTTATETTKDSFLRASSYDGNAHTVTIKNGTIALNDSYKFALTVSTAITLNLESVTINNARTDNLGSGLIVATGSTVNLDENCVINAKGTYTAVEVAGGTLNVNGATISAEGGEGIALSVSYEGTAKVASGTITGSEAALYVFPTEGTINVTGGTFSTDPSEFVADGYLALKNYKTENYYDVVAVTVSNYRVRGSHANAWSWDDATPMYKITGTNYIVAKGVTFAANATFKFCADENWATQAGARTTTAVAADTWTNSGNIDSSKDIKVKTAGTYDVWFIGGGFSLVTADENPNFPTAVTADFYLNPNIWESDVPRYAAYFCNGTSEAKWVNMTDADMDGLWEVKVPTGENHTNIIFVRMNPATTANNWSNKYNQTGDLTVSNNIGQVFKVTSWDGQTSGWSTK